MCIAYRPSLAVWNEWKDLAPVTECYMNVVGITSYVSPEQKPIICHD